MRSLACSLLILALAHFAPGAGQPGGKGGSGARLRASKEGRCGVPPRYPHAELHRKYVDELDFSSGQKVYYKCGPDMTGASGRPSVECLDGTWTRLTLKCRKKSCGSAGDLLYGEYDYEGNAYIGERVYARCHAGYSLRGPSFRVCKASGWTSDKPTCEVGEPTCRHPTVSNSVSGALVATDYKVGESLSFICRPGFQLDGAQQATCGAGGRWHPEPPRCLPSPDPTTPASSTTGSEASGVPATRGSGSSRVPATTGNEASGVPATRGSGSSGVPATTGNEASTVQANKEAASPPAPKECGAPPATRVPQTSLAKKYVSMTTFASGYRVYYLCDVGYQQAGGSRYRKCIDGKWTALQLRCQRKLCGSAGEILNGQFFYTGVEFGDTATAVCNRGYRLVGRPTRHCFSRGWDGRVPVCEMVDCDEPPAVQDADVEGREDGVYTYGNVVHYHCRVGTLVGPQDVWCTNNGTWSAAPTCKQITCSPPDDPHVIWAGVPKALYNYRDALTVECRAGYKLTSDGSVWCGADGRWLPKPPTCVRAARRIPQRG